MRHHSVNYPWSITIFLKIRKGLRISAKPERKAVRLGARQERVTSLYKVTLLWQSSRMDKDFAGWHRLKVHLNGQNEFPSIRQRDIWWCSVGINIGHEVDGKSALYSRPVLIVRKFNQYLFLGVPLTTKIKENLYYHLIHFQGRQQCVMLSQLRLWEGRRLTRKLGLCQALIFGLVDWERPEFLMLTMH